MEHVDEGFGGDSDGGNVGFGDPVGIVFFHLEGAAYGKDAGRAGPKEEGLDRSAILRRTLNPDLAGQDEKIRWTASPGANTRSPAGVVTIVLAASRQARSSGGKPRSSENWSIHDGSIADTASPWSEGVVA